MTTEAFVTDPQDQNEPIHQTGTWYTRGSELVLTSSPGNVAKTDCWTDGNTFTRLDDMVSRTRMQQLNPTMVLPKRRALLCP